MQNPIAVEYLKTVRDRFNEVRQTAERTFAQLSDEQLFWSPNAESNSIAIIVKHISGNMHSRWTDFFAADGEKPNRDRDGEFILDATTRADLLASWDNGWSIFLGVLERITEADLLRTVYIRKQPHTVIAAIERQMYHYSYHVGQIVYIAKQLKDADWETLTIPRKQ
ncbi:MAG: hypothetical protein JWN15_4157 [Firmicutes bacterium]|nr:hypothetical protein [Bacillota bacterium]